MFDSLTWSVSVITSTNRVIVKGPTQFNVFKNQTRSHEIRKSELVFSQADGSVILFYFRNTSNDGIVVRSSRDPGIQSAVFSCTGDLRNEKLADLRSPGGEHVRLIASFDNSGTSHIPLGKTSTIVRGAGDPSSMTVYVGTDSISLYRASIKGKDDSTISARFGFLRGSNPILLLLVLFLVLISVF